MECHLWDWMGWPKTPTNWGRHRLHDLVDEVSKHESKWARTYGKKTNSSKVVVLERWN